MVMVTLACDVFLVEDMVGGYGCLGLASKGLDHVIMYFM